MAQETIVKTLRLKLLPHESLSLDKKEAWKKFRSIIREMAKQVAIVKNSVSLEYGINTLSYLVRHEKNSFPKVYSVGMSAILSLMKEDKIRVEKEVKEEEIRREKEKKTNNEKVKAIFRRPFYLSSALVNANANFVKDQISATRTEIIKGERSIPNYKNDGSIFLGYDGAGAGINQTSGAFRFIDSKTIRISAFLGKKLHKESTGSELLANVYVPHRKWGQREIFERIQTLEYIPLSANIIIKDRDIFLNLQYRLPKKPQQQIVPGRIAAVDMGIKKVATCLLSDKPYIKYIIHDEIWKTLTDYRARTAKQKKEIGRAMRGFNNCHSGHGAKHKCEVFDRLSGRDRDFQKFINNRISKGIINFAKKNAAEYIALEDLTGIFKSGKVPQRILRRWAYFELQTMIQQKAKEHNLEIIMVNPSYTTQHCVKCGAVSEQSVRSYKDFVCANCGHTTYNGINAALNIAALAELKLNTPAKSAASA